MSSTEERRTILEMVAEGKISAEDGVRMLEAMSGSAPAADEPDEDRVPIVYAGDDEPVKAVRVVGTFRTLRIIGDSSIKGASAEGAHRARTEDGTLVFEDEWEETGTGFTLFGPRRSQRGKVRFGANIRGHEFWFGDGGPPSLEIRMNPELPLEIDLTAGTASVSSVKGPIIANMAAGSARFRGVRSPFHAAVDAGSLSVAGLFNRGSSDIRCTAGKVRISLDPASSVRITARATLGKISLPNGKEWQGLGSGKREATIGSGEGTLDIEATTGAAVVSMDDESE